MTSSEEYERKANAALERAGHAMTSERMSAYAATANAYAQLATAAAIRDQAAAASSTAGTNRGGEQQ